MSFYVKEGLPLEDVPLLPLPHDAAAPPDVEIARQNDGVPAAPESLSTGACVGIGVGSTAAAAGTAAVAVLWWKRRRRQAGMCAGIGRTPLQLPSFAAAAPARPDVVSCSGLQLKARSSLPTELPLHEVERAAAGADPAGKEAVVQISGAAPPMSSPRRRPAGSPRRPDLPAASRALLPLLIARPVVHEVAVARHQALGEEEPSTGQAAPNAEAETEAGAVARVDAEEEDDNGSILPALVQQLRDSSAEWEGVLVPESELKFVQGPNGQPAVLGRGG